MWDRDAVSVVNFFFLMIRRPPRSTQSRASAASDVYKIQMLDGHRILVDGVFFAEDGVTPQLVVEVKHTHGTTGDKREWLRSQEFDYVEVGAAQVIDTHDGRVLVIDAKGTIPDCEACRILDNEAATKLLGEACYRGNLQDVQRALKAGAGVNVAMHWGHDGSMGSDCTAAYVAAYHDHADILRFLGAAGADPDKGDTSDGETPCIRACINDHAECVRVLLALGADPNRADKHGDTPWKWAKSEACKEALRAGGPGGVCTQKYRGIE